MSSEPYTLRLRRISGNLTRHYFEHEQLVGSTQGLRGTHSLAGQCYSAYEPCLAYFCPICGDLWGRSIPSFTYDYEPDGSMPPWLPEQRACVEHGDGQFLAELDSADDDLLARELLALLENER